MTKKQPKNTDKALLKRAGRGPKAMQNYEPDITPTAIATVNARTKAQERAFYERNGLFVPEEYQEGYDILDKDNQMEGYVEDKKFNPVRIISPKNAKYSD